MTGLPAPLPRVVVQGQAERSVPPDTAVVTVTVGARERGREQAMAELAERQQAVLDLLTARADVVGEHATESVWVSPAHAEDGSGRVVGHLAQLSTRVRLDDVDAVGAFLLTAGALAGVSVHGPQWQLRAAEEVHAEVRELAVLDAVARARAHARTMGTELADLVELRDVPGARGGAERWAVQAAPASGGGLDVEPGSQQVRAQVEMTFTVQQPDLTALGR
ncbi:DUF541 domain-containing protein [Modestobacter sp. I12A-02628]|uniref:SIMPL domain-containing protein n=1 Tax=Goekera deserti TaxID=2497753 RepID=A0A7K3WC59_9ACTN|nr:SIMPL domain-containing protein [Goekera deserti]MPQ98361.1 DUF541 domain-containing protein [Goekera deserti]NDI48188.1 DUF541 domain-containing protein [Goekera deserti]NEL53937.1 SIMPL domain-containing protein [Goekera deserti]